jgi:Flp pilus assembly protein TadG
MILPKLSSTGFMRSTEAGAAVEFALVGLAFFGFLLGIINAGLLGLGVSTITRSVQSTARWASVQASASYAQSGSTITEPCFDRTMAAFNSFITAPIPPMNTASAANGSANGTETTGPTTVLVNWTSGSSAGAYLTVTATYTWQPLGFAAFGVGFPVSITTATPVIGSSSAAVAPTCS